jgi:tetratricopeptide (TPR) repeat protein
MLASMSEDSPERARSLARGGDLKGAAQVFTRYLESTPGDALAHYQLANLTLKLGNAVGAVESFQRALALEPDKAEIHNDLGTALEHAGREPDAAEAYRRAARARPPFPPAQYNLALILGRRDQWDEAARFLRTALEQTPDFRAARQQLGVVLRELGQNDAARACFDDLLTADPKDIEARRAIADMDMDHCCFADAAEQLEQCLALAPEDTQATLELGACLQELGRVDEALTHYRRLLARDRSCYYAVVKKLTSAARGRFWVKTTELRRILLG